ncbi:MAG: mechanosensitive ion channel family protein [Kiritimatiellaeota bacterium]|nr:mechanosensitive ion channel family protein [Kiritimatiellota bacterium]
MYVEHVKHWLLQNGISFAMTIVQVIVLFVAGKFLITWLVGLARKAMLKVCKGKPLIPNLAASALSKILWVLLLLIVAKSLGVDTTPLVAALGVTGFVVGFACQDSLANLAAGVMIAMNEPFVVGDSVTVAGVTGVIHEVSMMATVVRDESDNRVVIPNKAAWGGVITNRTEKNWVKRDVTSG